MIFYFNVRYFTLAVLLFAVEVSIALFISDQIIRPFVGDVLVVVLLYCFVSSFFKIDRFKIALGALIFAFIIEILQYFDYVKMLGLEHNRMFSIIMGRTFEWIDFAAYFVGFLLIILTENFIKRSKN